MPLNRRELLAAAVPWPAATDGRGALLWDYFMRELDAADALRRERLARVRSRAELDGLRERVRRRLLEAIGGFPRRTPLRAHTAGMLKRSGYVIEKIVFESRPHYYVTANLYRPERVARPLPAVIESCGHYREGKAAPDYQKACAGLAGKGIVALVFDPMGQGERRMYRDVVKEGGSGTSEHVLAGNACYLVGRTLAHFRIWDAIRALDYLETRPEVDQTRLGMFGHSGGGMMTLLTAPLEPRLRAVMSCCAVTSFYHKTRALLTADPEQIVPGIYPEGIDHPELIAATGPRAFLIGAALKDYVPLAGARRTYDEARAVLEAAGFAQAIAKVETDDEHKLNRELREACYGWMLKHLAGGETDTREPDLPVETEADLRCTPTGYVMDIAGARSVADLNRDLAPPRERGVAALGALLALPARALELPSKTTVPRSRPDTLLVVIGPTRNAALARDLAGSGCAVMELDLRGWGETTPEVPGAKPGFRADDFFAYRAIELGRPLLGMRVGDLLAAVAEARRSYPRVCVIGLRQGGVVALHAAALSREIAGVAAVGSLASYQEVIRQGWSREPVSSFVPGALLHYDLPQLAEAVRPRPCWIAKEPAGARAILEALRLPTLC